MKTKHYTAVKQGSHVLVSARDPAAKQTFFSWGSGSDRVAAQFYGNSFNEKGYYGNPDYILWKWTLDADAVDEMIHNIDDHINDKTYYSGRTEVARAKELSGLLKKVSR